MIVQDVVVLNKVDLVPGELADVEAQIRNINALVRIVHSVRCQLNLRTSLIAGLLMFR
jgi:G3E family GTPase